MRSFENYVNLAGMDLSQSLCRLKRGFYTKEKKGVLKRGFITLTVERNALNYIQALISHLIQW